MNSRVISLLARISIVILASTATGCHGPSPDWNGTWKLDPDRSRVAPPTITVSITPDGMYHSTGGGGTANFGCDGKAYKATDILTIFCTGNNSSGLEITAFKNEAKMFTSRWELSSDGKMLTVKSTRFHTDGSVKSKDSLYMRTSGSAGFAGVWKDMDSVGGSPSILQISMGSNALHYSQPESEIHADAFIDGTDAAIQGPLVNSGASIALRERGPRELGVTYKKNGRVTSVGNWRISTDGRSLTESYWIPGRPNDRAVLVYNKQ